MNSAMLPQKCTYFIRRFLDMGPRTAAWLTYHRIRKRLFIARAKTIHPSSTNLISHIRTDPTFDFLRTQHHQDAYHAADRVAVRTFTILGHVSHTFAQDITWHKDFTCNAASPQAWQSSFYAALTIPAHADNLQPDIKIPWELSRSSWCCDLGYGYAGAIAHNDTHRARRYAQTFVTYLENWIAKNPFLFGVNWVNPMEVALRGINLVRALHLFKHEPCIPDTFWTSYGTLLMQHITYLEHNWEVSDRPNNHYLADLVGHFYLCTCLRFIARYNRAQHATARKIFDQLKHQILPDGADYEGSTHYHHLVTQLTELFIELADHSDITIPSHLRTQLTRMQQFTADCSDHAEKLVLIGDEDGGSIGNPIAMSILASEARQNVSGGATTYPHFGLSIIKDSRIHLAFRHPTYASHQPTGHFHNDQLSITLSIKGIQLLVDPGTYCYTANADERNYFRSFAAHNTFCIPAITDGTTHLFMLNRQQHPRAPTPQTHDTCITLQDFYHATAGMQLHRRITYDQHNDSITIDDWPEIKDSATNKNFDMHWSLHVAPGIIVIHESEDRWALTRDGVCYAYLQTSLAYMVLHDVVSPQYGLKVASTTLRAVTNSRAPQRMVISLLHKNFYVLNKD